MFVLRLSHRPSVLLSIFTVKWTRLRYTIRHTLYPSPPYRNRHCISPIVDFTDRPIVEVDDRQRSNVTLTKCHCTIHPRLPSNLQSSDSFYQILLRPLRLHPQHSPSYITLSPFTSRTFRLRPIVLYSPRFFLTNTCHPRKLL